MVVRPVWAWRTRKPYKGTLRQEFEMHPLRVRLPRVKHNVCNIVDNTGRVRTYMSRHQLHPATRSTSGFTAGSELGYDPPRARELKIATIKFNNCLQPRHGYDLRTGRSCTNIG